MTKSKPTRIYNRKHGQKRGKKLGELSSNATLEDCLQWIRDYVHFRYEPHIFRTWSRGGETIIDYGNHGAYIIINKALYYKGELKWNEK